MTEQNHSGNYNHVRCLTCGCAWLAGINERTGEMEPGHPADAPCAIHRPTDLAPGWVADALARHELAATASNLPPTADDSEVARRELAGGVPTREWAGAGVRVERSGYIRVVDGEAAKNGESHA
jgi:hypothetical protein